MDTEDFVDKKIAENEKFIKITFFEIRVKMDLSKEEADEFLNEIKEMLCNDYILYDNGEEYYYRGIKKVETNELLVAIKK